MSELRQRQVPRRDSHSDYTSDSGSCSSSDSADSHSHSAKQKHPPQDDDPRISILDILRVVVTLALTSCGLSYYMTNSESFLWGYRPWFTRMPVVIRYLKGPLTLTPPELALYNGTDPSLPVYLAVNASIFDVSANPMIYGPGGSYHFFAGKDATRAFVTGCFKEDLTPDLVGVEEMFLPVDGDDEEGKKLSSAQLKIRREKEVRVAREQVDRVVRNWEGFFRNHKRYFQVGRVGGVQNDERDAGNRKRELCEAARLNRPRRGES